MKIIDRLKDGCKDKNYFISVYDDGIYIINYESIKLISEKIVKIKFNSFSVIIKGINLRVKRKAKYDLELSGKFTSMEIDSELHNN